jgi:hypothetical protein
LRTQILTPEELHGCLPEAREFHPLTFVEFCEFLRATLCKKYSLWTERNEKLNLKPRSRSRGLPPLASPPRPSDRLISTVRSIVDTNRFRDGSAWSVAPSCCAAEISASEGAAIAPLDIVC